MLENIVIKGARQNNLKNVNVTIPRNKLVVLTGVSGSGKSTLAFDTIFAEGQRRYMESLSSYARQFLGQMDKPDVDSIDGLSPSIAIDQKSTSHNPRSTVGTVTEIYDYLRLLFAHVGVPYCPHCKKKITPTSVDVIVDNVMQLEENTKIMIEAPVYRGKKGSFVAELDAFRKDGFQRVRIDGEVHELEEDIVLEKNLKHDLSVIVDRLIIREGVEKRLSESIETSLKMTGGIVSVTYNEEEHIFNSKLSCPTCGYSLSEISPRIFSFNNPFGACPDCLGIGYKQIIDIDKLVKAPNLTLLEGAIGIGWVIEPSFLNTFYKAVMDYHNVDYSTPFKDMPKKAKDMIFYGSNGEKIPCYMPWLKKHGGCAFEGIVPIVEKRYRETTSEFIKTEINKLMYDMQCPTCHGNRLKEEVLNILINGKNIAEVSNLSINDLYAFMDNINLTKANATIAEPILKEIKARLEFLINVGLDYLELSRYSNTLSGGESQRIRLATQIGSGLTGVIYILDEPSIGLHQRDNEKLLETLKRLRDIGNTVLVVEHDEDTMRSADYLIDVGPYAGIHGGEIVAEGSIDDIMNSHDSITGKYLSGEWKIDTDMPKNKISNGFISIKGAKQNNLKNIDVDIPIGVITAVTGVSGSGKSSLVNDILYPAFNNYVNHSHLVEGKYKKIIGLDAFDKVINIDQSPIGRTPRSNPATYTNVFTDIRELFAKTSDAKERGYTAGRFSFNISGGRCEACGGAGINKIEMYFMPDVYVPCDVCDGKRYNRETLQVKYKGKNIYDVLDMSIDEAYTFFEAIPKIKNKLQTLVDVGLGYIKLGQPATELSGGEAQRVKLATELSRRGTGKSLYILDEPTTGLHFYDVDKLIKILRRLADGGNTVVVIEHNLDVIKSSDYIIDLGPEGGVGGGQIVVAGTPDEVKKSKKGYTYKYL
ncbi:MAG: excinuclease ABC subunit UvrA [Clostridiales bacterium]|nr:excinuclease ABC subunit UvrA [Clostridiales bacterium]